MRITIIRVFLIIISSLMLSNCNGQEIKGNMHVNCDMSVNLTPPIFSEVHKIKEEIKLESFDFEKNQVFHLNNRATSFEDYLYISSMYADYVFSDRDEQGDYHLWQGPEEMFSGITRVYYFFKYNNQLVCICENEKGNNEIIIYNLDFTIQNRKEIELSRPKYICGNLLYIYSNSTEYSIIKSINLDSLEENEIYSCKIEKQLGFIVNHEGEIIISQSFDEFKTIYFEYKGNLLIPIIETNSSIPVRYDSRGLFYLKDIDSKSHMNLMLWNGSNSQKIGAIKTDDMDRWIFLDGVQGNIIIRNDFFVSIHTMTENPYLLVQSFDSTDNKRISLKKWPFTEADIERYGETFSGIYYENGQIINYFFSDTAGLLQTQVLIIK